MRNGSLFLDAYTGDVEVDYETKLINQKTLQKDKGAPKSLAHDRKQDLLRAGRAPSYDEGSEGEIEQMESVLSNEDEQLKRPLLQKPTALNNTTELSTSHESKYVTHADLEQMETIPEEEQKKKGCCCTVF